MTGVLIVAAGVGLVLGTILGSVGGGGGVLAVPALVWFCGLPVHDAIGGSVAAVGLAAAIGSVPHIRRGDICPRLAATVSVAALPASAIGTWASRRAPATLLLTLLALAMLASAALLWRREAIPSHDDSCGRATPSLVASAGAATGLLNGLLGVGGGVVLVPVFILGFRVDARRAIGTSLIVIALASAASLAFHSTAGANHWKVVAPFALAAAGASAFAARTSATFPRIVLVRGLSSVLVLVAVLVLARAHLLDYR